MTHPVSLERKISCVKCGFREPIEENRRRVPNYIKPRVRKCPRCGYAPLAEIMVVKK